MADKRTEDDIRSSPYAPFLEATLRGIMEDQPRSIGVVALNGDGAYGLAYHNANPADLAQMAFHILAEALTQKIMDTVLDNIDAVADALDGEDLRSGVDEAREDDPPTATEILFSADFDPDEPAPDDEDDDG